MYCKTCGSPVEEAKMHCPNCGAKMTADNMSLIPIAEKDIQKDISNNEKQVIDSNNLSNAIASTEVVEPANEENIEADNGAVKPIDGFDYKKKKQIPKVVIIILGTCLAFGLFFIAIITWGYVSLQSFKSADYIKFDDESIISYYSTSENTNLLKVSKSVSSTGKTITLTYKKDTISQEQLSYYMEQLENNKFIITNITDDDVTLSSESQLNGMVLIVKIDNNNDNTIDFIYKRVNGTLTRYTK